MTVKYVARFELRKKAHSLRSSVRLDTKPCSLTLKFGILVR